MAEVGMKVMSVAEGVMTSSYCLRWPYIRRALKKRLSYHVSVAMPIFVKRLDPGSEREKNLETIKKRWNQ